MCKLAIIQTAPVILDRARTLALAVDLVDRAVAEGAELVVFPEAFIAGYPAWVWRLRPGTDWGLSEACHRRLLDSAVDRQHGDLEPLTEAAERHGITLLCGMHERDAELSRATLYNTYVVIGADGRILNRHRKLMPTNPERMIWGFGDASGLKVVDPATRSLSRRVARSSRVPCARSKASSTRTWTRRGSQMPDAVWT
jgi:nitrilase